MLSALQQGGYLTNSKVVVPSVAWSTVKAPIPCQPNNLSLKSNIVTSIDTKLFSLALLKAKAYIIPLHDSPVAVPCPDMFVRKKVSFDEYLSAAYISDLNSLTA